MEIGKEKIVILLNSQPLPLFSSHKKYGIDGIQLYSYTVKIIGRCDEFLRSREHIDLDLAPAQLWEHQVGGDDDEEDGEGDDLYIMPVRSL